MKKLLLLALSALSLSVNAQIKMPAPSSTQTISQDFGLGKIELTYSRPNIKGRSLFKENSELAPLGKVWRTGANAVTKIKFSDPVTMGEKAIDTGTYAIWTIPGKKEWTIIINKDAKNWGTVYSELDDLVRFKVDAETMKESVETFTMQFANIKPESCELDLMWGNTYIPIPLTTNIKARIRLQVEKALTADNINPNVYNTAANFYYEWDKDYNKALLNISKFLDANPKNIGGYILRGRIEKELVDKASAKTHLEKAIQLATDAKNEDYIRTAKGVLGKL